MSMRRRNFEVDRENGKMLGVCAGLANTTGIDATVIRIGAVLLAAPAKTLEEEIAELKVSERVDAELAAMKEARRLVA